MIKTRNHNKSLFSIFLLVIIFSSQISYSQKIVENSDSMLLRDNSLSNIPCNPNTFWLNHIDQNNPGLFNIREYTLINNSITSTGYVLYNIHNRNIGYGNNISNISLKTFYNIDSYSTNALLMYNGSSWDTLPMNIANHQFFNIGGCKSTIAFQGRDTTSNPKHIYKYNSGAIEIYSSPQGVSITGADIAVDSLEHIWFFEAFDSAIFEPHLLKVIDNNGNLINSYPIAGTIDFYHCYGMFILNNLLYVGVGNLNTSYPNCLIPFSIINDTANQETPILFIAPSNRFDLESCNQGTLTSISEVPESLKELSVYPNPVQEQFMLHLPYRTSQNANIQIYNIQGELVKTIKASDTSPINCSTWPRGMYFVSLVEEGKARVTKKVMVI